MPQCMSEIKVRMQKNGTVALQDISLYKNNSKKLKYARQSKPI